MDTSSEGNLEFKSDDIDMGKPYTEQFKRDAVQLLISSGRPLSEVSGELGVTANSLREWKKRFLAATNADLRAVGGSGKGKLDAVAMAEEIRELRRENEYLKRQREILKKAASILAEDPRLGMR